MFRTKKDIAYIKKHPQFLLKEEIRTWAEQRKQNQKTEENKHQLKLNFRKEEN